MPSTVFGRALETSERGGRASGGISRRHLAARDLAGAIDHRATHQRSTRNDAGIFMADAAMTRFVQPVGLLPASSPACTGAGLVCQATCPAPPPSRTARSGTRLPRWRAGRGIRWRRCLVPGGAVAPWPLRPTKRDGAITANAARPSRQGRGVADATSRPASL
jgi:hypothetical protein